MSMEEYDLYERDEPALSSWEQELYDSVSREAPWALVEEFSGLERHPGSEDERRAAEYIESRFDEYGVEYERYEPELWVSEKQGDVSVRAVSPVGESFDNDGDRPSLKAQTWSGSDTVRGELVYLEVPEVSVKEFRDVTLDDMMDDDQELEGKVVAIGKQLLSAQIVTAVEERGAVGYVNVHPHEEEPHLGDATPIWGGIPTPDQADLLPEIPLVTATSGVGDRLKELLDEHGTVEVEVSTDVPRRWETCPFVVAEIPAEAAETDDFVLLHGHYDSVVYGTTDNATGNAGMVECARILNQHRDKLQRNLRIGFWSVHEGQRYGASTWYVDENAHDIYEHCVAHVNFDSPGAKDATEFEEFVTWMPEADPLCRGAIDDVAGKDSVENRTRRSGDYSFYNLGVTGMLALSSSIPKEVRDARGYHTVSGSGGNADAWHLSTDTLDKADPDVLVRDIRIYLTIMARLLGSDVLPLDYRRTVDRHREIVTQYDEAAAEHFDFGPLSDELASLEDAVDTFYEALDAGEIDPAVANETMKGLSRHLVRVNFITKGRFEQDLAIQNPPYPALEPATTLDNLEGNDYRFQRLELKRSRNEVEHELREARRTVEDAV